MRPETTALGGRRLFFLTRHTKGSPMFDKRMIASVVAASFVLAAITRLVPQLAPSSVASYLPSFGSSNGSDN